MVLQGFPQSKDRGRQVHWLLKFPIQLRCYCWGSFVKNCTRAAQNKTIVTDAMEMTRMALTEKQIFIDAFVHLPPDWVKRWENAILCENWFFQRCISATVIRSTITKSVLQKLEKWEIVLQKYVFNKNLLCHKFTVLWSMQILLKCENKFVKHYKIIN